MQRNGVIKIPKNSKYNAKKVKYKELIFDSDLEMRYYRDYIEPRIESGEIIKCDMQVNYELQPKFEYMDKKERAIVYRSDFDLTYADGHFVVIDTKGMVKPMDMLKLKMFKYKYPNIEIQFIGYSKTDGGFVPVDVIKKGRKERKKIKEAAK